MKGALVKKSITQKAGCSATLKRLCWDIHYGVGVGYLQALYLLHLVPMSNEITRLLILMTLSRKCINVYSCAVAAFFQLGVD